MRQAYATGRINQVAIIIFNIKIDIRKTFSYYIIIYDSLTNHISLYNIHMLVLNLSYENIFTNTEIEIQFIVRMIMNLFDSTNIFINILSIAISYNQLMIKKRSIHAFFIQLILNLIKKKKRVQGKFYLNYFQYQLRSEKRYK